MSATVSLTTEELSDGYCSEFEAMAAWGQCWVVSESVGSFVAFPALK